MDRHLAKIRILRPGQWIKNALVFLPVIVGEVKTLNVAGKAVIAFFLFSMTASVGYIVNDLIDRETDRLHPSKRNRPIASRKVSFTTALTIATTLSVAVVAISLVGLNQESIEALLSYFVLTLTYSRFLKSVAILDIIVLACFYPIRVIVGAAATEISLSTHLIAFVFFFSLILAVGKRFAERKLYEDRKKSGYAAQLRTSLESIPQMFLLKLLYATVAIAVGSYVLWLLSESEYVSDGFAKIISIIPLIYLCFKILYIAEVRSELLEYPERLLKHVDIFSSSTILVILIVL